MIVPNRIPKTVSMRYPPTMGKTTFGHEYHEYKLANWYVLTPIESLI
jgi:hypothetical protein